MVPELLGAGCSLLEFSMRMLRQEGHLVQLPGPSTWAATFGEAAVCSAVLRKLNLEGCGIRGPLPELRLPALQELNLDRCSTWTGGQPAVMNKLTGGLEPLRNCTALRHLHLSGNLLTGGLEPLRGCTALQTLNLSSNKMTGGLEGLRACTALLRLHLQYNQLTGGLEPLRSCKALRTLHLVGNPLAPTVKDTAHFHKQCQHFSRHSELGLNIS